MTTTIQIGDDNTDDAQQKQRMHPLVNNNHRRSAFIPEEADGKQFISKDESEMLRNSILRVNRPRISRPWFDQPQITQNGLPKDSARSNSSSGCSSNPQSSGPSSPVSSKCSSENGGSEQRKKMVEEQQQNGNIGIGSKGALKFEKSPPPQMLSASLVQKVAANQNSNSPAIRPSMEAPVNNSHSSLPNASILSNLPLPMLKRKEFPSHQRRVPMPPPQKNLPPKNQLNVAPPKIGNGNYFVPAMGRRIVDPAEEVEELSRAARKQMAILEELEVEDRERKTRRNVATRANEDAGECGIHVVEGSPGSSRESTTTRLSSNSSNSAASSLALGNNRIRPSCSPSTSSGTSSLTGNEWSPTATTMTTVPARSNRQSAGEKQRQNGEKWGLPELMVEDISRRRRENERREIPVELEENNDGKNDGNARKLLECSGCGGMITDVILQALGSSFHPACFRCSKCGKCLDGVPFVVEQGGTVICMDDYERNFVPHCHACRQPINAVNEFGQVVRVVIKDREFHIQCYSCEGCGMQLSNEEPSRCFPLEDHLLCRRCNTLWRRMGALDSEAAVSDL